MEQCGHCIHLEKPQEIVKGIFNCIPELKDASESKQKLAQSTQ